MDVDRDTVSAPGPVPLLHHGAPAHSVSVYHEAHNRIPVEYEVKCSRHLYHGTVIVLSKGIGGRDP